MKSNKAYGNDHVINEFLKNSVDVMMPVYVKLFNLIRKTGVFPEDWTSGITRSLVLPRAKPEASPASAN